ncbi:hypothetical protein TruAng_004728 [Truncatella angustata]|nr:hypothetical protein TruAng_004728 [Truncatella angustata]
MGARGLMAAGVPPQPRWLLIIKGVIILLSIIVLALSAYSLSLYSGYYYYSGGAPGYLIFLAVKTWIIYGASIAIELKAPQYYYRIVFLIAYSLSAIFWLSGWAWAASWAAALLDYAYYSNSFGGAMAGNAAIGAIIWVLVVVNLVFFILASCRDNTTANVELGHTQKHSHPQGPAAPVQQESYTGQPQPGYPQQQSHNQP